MSTGSCFQKAKKANYQPQATTYLRTLHRALIEGVSLLKASLWGSRTEASFIGTF